MFLFYFIYFCSFLNFRFNKFYVNEADPYFTSLKKCASSTMNFALHLCNRINKIYFKEKLRHCTSSFLKTHT